ncbi:pesticidal protein Cry26Aa [Actinobacteria bacterium YIM 96077]|uniref:Pesticidal protein Cry26Aa n=1 Tax=Phytoactinopolyspora halophila TaxID=1981511 RepID=A0A329R2S1_9ACTN|nr:monovalent cation/H+ antiporter complex subunit F [Phytoactinopolyspora halophila]AYY11773.1 pesticidal protein Cry26Aa [Actinobacteria bacterium YIM 96077]RAW17792.1 pesticidal protein Cry26Aa [Phytoactinopolyspora halophila]
MNPVDLALVVIAVTYLPVIWRIFVGPTDADRATAGDFAFYLFVAATALLAVRNDQPMFFDIVLIATLIGFLGTVVLARLVDRRDR